MYLLVIFAFCCSTCKSLERDCNSLVFESKRKFLVGCYRLTFQHPAIVFVTYRKLQKCLYSNSRNGRRYLFWLVEQMFTITLIRLDLAFKNTLGKAGKNGKYCSPVYWEP